MRRGPAPRTKDIEIAAWLTEAMLRLHGFAGLRDGFRLIGELVALDWDGVYPAPGEEGIEGRVASLSGLNGIEGEGTLIVPIRRTSLTDGEGDHRLALWQYQQAHEIDAITDADKRQKRVAMGAVTKEQLEAAVGRTSPEFFKTLYDDLGQCGQAFEALNTLLSEKCGSDAPPASRIREALEACTSALTDMAGAHVRAPAAGAAPASAGGPTNGKGSPAPALPLRVADAAGMGRDEALQTVAGIAEFFRHTEPHSPLSYLLDQAVRWGRMDLPELMTELLAEGDGRDRYFRLTGIKAQSK